MTPKQISVNIEQRIAALQHEVRAAVARSVALSAIGRDDKIFIQVSLGELATYIRELGMANGLALAAATVKDDKNFMVLDLGPLSDSRVSEQTGEASCSNLD
jgi:hypothetical protein